MGLLDDPAELPQLTETVAALNGLSNDAVTDLSRAAELFAASGVYTRAVAAGAWKELPVIGMVDDVPVDGVIDLIYRDGAQWVIADYKTDASATAAVVGSYFAQLSLYAQLLESTDFAPVGRIELVFARVDHTVTRTRVRDGAGSWVAAPSS